MIIALQAPGSQDLSQFSRLLWQRKFSHHIAQQTEQQLVLVAQTEQVEPVRELFRQWQLGTVQPQSEDSSALSGYLSSGVVLAAFKRAISQSPLTLLLVLVCTVLWLVAPLDSPGELTQALLYPDFSNGTSTIVLSQVLASFTLHQCLRLLTPILLHGGLVHLAFNMSWFWELGRRIERVQSSWTFAITIVLIGLCSNTVQYIYGGGNNFGGMSGVVYGLFAYIWTWQLFDPRKGLALPGALILFMVGSLIVFTYLDLDMIANAGHIGGFLAGMFYGAGFALTSRMLRVASTRVEP